MEFKAKLVNDSVEVEPIIEKKKNSNGGDDIIVHVPNFRLIDKLKKEHG